jgi:hypothetical protein
VREVGRVLLWGVVSALVAALVLVLAGQKPLPIVIGALIAAVAIALAFEFLPLLRNLELRFPIGRVTRKGNWQATDAERIRRYQGHRGLFLVHESAVPSRDPTQKADVVVRLAQHGDGPLTQGTVASVEYVFGNKFEDHVRVKTQAEGGFAISESLWAPLLIMARVCFTDSKPDLLLERYINIHD